MNVRDKGNEDEKEENEKEDVEEEKKNKAYSGKESYNWAMSNEMEGGEGGGVKRGGVGGRRRE